MARQAAELDRQFNMMMRNVTGPEAVADYVRWTRQQLAEVIRSGSGSPRYRTVVNGIVGRVESDVIPPGPIVYYFDWLREVAEYALTYLRERSPRSRQSNSKGHYADEHMLYQQGRPATLNGLRPLGEVQIVNTKPYARKIHVGAKGFLVSKGIYTDAMKAVNSRWRGIVEAEVDFVNIRKDNYVLRTGKKKGELLTYPALLITVL